jgi:hypothetical protein
MGVHERAAPVSWFLITPDVGALRGPCTSIEARRPDRLGYTQRLSTPL